MVVAIPTVAAADVDGTLKVHQAAITNPADDAAFKAYLDSLPRLPPILDDTSERYLVEGDVAKTADEVRAYLKGFGGQESLPPPGEPELILNIANGSALFWPRGERDLKFAIARTTFGSQANIDKVSRDIGNAAADWKAICDTCDVTFTYKPEHDGVQTWDEVKGLMDSGELTFIVVHVDSRGQFLAAAFFPGDGWQQRVLSIDTGYYKQQMPTGRGILRHELGHMLGYRHEHIRGIQGCSNEDSSWMPLTTYDPKSVMHYFCGSGGTQDLTLSPLDIAGHRRVYGQ